MYLIWLKSQFALNTIFIVFRFYKKFFKVKSQVSQTSKYVVATLKVAEPEFSGAKPRILLEALKRVFFYSRCFCLTQTSSTINTLTARVVNSSLFLLKLLLELHSELDLL